MLFRVLDRGRTSGAGQFQCDICAWASAGALIWINRNRPEIAGERVIGLAKGLLCKDAKQCLAREEPQ